MTIDAYMINNIRLLYNNILLNVTYLYYLTSDIADKVLLVGLPTLGACGPVFIINYY